MGEARHHRAGVFERLFGERLLIERERAVELVDRVAYPQAKIGRHLIVARARGMQPSGRRTDQLGEPRLHVHVDVLERALEFERAGFDL